MTQPDDDSNPQREPAFTLVAPGNEAQTSRPGLDIGTDPDPESVRNDFWWVYERMGGRCALLEWAETHAKEFFRMFFQLFPREANDEVNSVTALVETLRELALEDLPSPPCPTKDEKDG